MTILNEKKRTAIFNESCNHVCSVYNTLQEVQDTNHKSTIDVLKLVKNEALGVNKIHNCYRAILAIVNYLGSVCSRKECLTEMYQDLSEIAYYIMVEDEDSLLKGIEQITMSINELENEVKPRNQEKDAIFKLALNEIRTHMEYLRIQLGQ